MYMLNMHLSMNDVFCSLFLRDCQLGSPCMKDACKHAKRHRWFNVLLSTAAAEGMFCYM